eukprot:CAMPEP_0202919542 /NCGR_PEP_ID=MMETSP1392-20130828/76107_1 /ASSEMBLY_ACC=CAM_ASM_000868 /TAXON_ID=225041 /ORGANISM="Chlamydomonas chlamydogama, Strain SAG 11-48b" /LENGTH=30 /DNA_ID= /DNA_START= /DNA_END= /DNA_ORIENTATION=
MHEQLGDAQGVLHHLLRHGLKQGLELNDVL